MARYFFDITDCKGFHPDDFGDELDNFEEARDQAQVLLPDIARQELPDGEFHMITCDVRDDSGRTVYRGKLTFEGVQDPV